MYLAQLNIAKAKAPMEDPMLKEFVDNLEPINKLAEQSPGFIWRLQDESGAATSFQAFDDPLIISNMSLWQSVQHLKDFIYKTHHLDFLVRKEDWFDRLPEGNQVMWWVEDNHRPDLKEATQRLMHLREHGESPYAFTFRRNFSLEDALALEKA
ncbi:MAG: DUF3291 domain-containing protein [Bermanella sp.]